MRFILKERSHVRLYNNIVISLLCTSSLFTGYYKVNVDNEVKHTNAREIVDVDLEPLSQEAKAGKVVKKSKNKVTYVSSRQEVNTSNKGYYVPASYSSVTGEAVANYALKYLGLPYKRASQGTSLKTGTDCSGFTMLIYREFGVSLSRTPGGQMRNGRGVSRKELQKGDLVIYGRGNRAAHVALYIGNGKVIHESTPGQGVKITGIDNMGMRILSYRRVINAKAIAKVEGEKKAEASKVEASKQTTTTTNTQEETKKEDTSKTPEVKEVTSVADVKETTQAVTTTETTKETTQVATTTETTQAVETPKVVEEKKEEASPTPVTTETTDTSVKTENE